MVEKNIVTNIKDNMKNIEIKLFGFEQKKEYRENNEKGLLLSSNNPFIKKLFNTLEKTTPKYRINKTKDKLTDVDKKLDGIRQNIDYAKSQNKVPSNKLLKLEKQLTKESMKLEKKLNNQVNALERRIEWTRKNYFKKFGYTAEQAKEFAYKPYVKPSERVNTTEQKISTNQTPNPIKNPAQTLTTSKSPTQTPKQAYNLNAGKDSPSNALYVKAYYNMDSEQKRNFIKGLPNTIKEKMKANNFDFSKSWKAMNRSDRRLCSNQLMKMSPNLMKKATAVINNFKQKALTVSKNFNKSLGGMSKGMGMGMGFGLGGRK